MKFIDALYSNIDKKLKIFAVISLLVGVVLSVILAISCFAQASNINDTMQNMQSGFLGGFIDDSYKNVSSVFTKMGLYVLIGGCTFSVGFSLVLYGVGFIAQKFSARKPQPYVNHNMNTPSQNVNAVNRGYYAQGGMNHQSAVAPNNYPNTPIIEPAPKVNNQVDNRAFIDDDEVTAHIKKPENMTYQCVNCGFVNSINTNRCAQCGAPNPNFRG
ncbi:MAG: hypothetical protein IKB73_03855 [Ruminococcus sp.]|nr:hypothetical protein [Ruminococcus sp.]